MHLSVLHWNIWMDNQVGDKNRYKDLCLTLNRLINEENPDIICLNEAMGTKDKVPIAEYIMKHGYKYSVKAVSRTWDSKTDTYNVIVSKYKIKTSTIENINKNQGSLVRAVVQVDGYKCVDVISTHLIHLRPQTLLKHYKHIAFVARYLNKLKTDNPIIMCGDFNEPRYMPFSSSFINRRDLRVITGNRKNPTWYKNASIDSFLKVNPDKMFWSKNTSIDLMEFRVLSYKISDHRPLIGIFEVKNEKTI